MSSARFQQRFITAILAAGVTAETPDAELKKAFFNAAKVPVSNANLEGLRAALNGNADNIKPDSVPGTPAAPKAPKAAKEPKAPREPKAVVPAETAEACLARCKADPATAERWARVIKVEEMGKKGATRVTIKCDDKGPEGQDLFRTIKIQDLFQVKFSEGYAKKNARKSKAAAASTTEAPSAS